MKIQKGDEANKNTIHAQQIFYYTCDVEKKIGAQSLDDGEKALDFALQFVPIGEAIRVNADFGSDNTFTRQMAERERRVLEITQNSMV